MRAQVSFCDSRMLGCGHSFCEQCLELMFKQSDNSLVCPTCLKSHQFKEKEELTKLIKNFALLQLVEARQSTRKDGKIKRKVSLLEEEKSSGKERGEAEEAKEEEFPELKFNQKCSKHPAQVVHSFNLQTRHLLCSNCIYE